MLGLSWWRRRKFRLAQWLIGDEWGIVSVRHVEDMAEDILYATTFLKRSGSLNDGRRLERHAHRKLRGAVSSAMYGVRVMRDNIRLGW